MNNLDAIQYLAHAEARNFAPWRLDGDDGIMTAVPRLVVTKDEGGGGYRVAMQGHQGHDNEGRAPLICEFVRASVLANLDPAINAAGVYPIELHDSYTYLATDSAAHRARYRGCLTFSKDLSHRHTVLFPDPYQIGGYGGMLGVKDERPFAQKASSVLFAGTTTGARSPKDNERIRACVWALNHRPRYEFYITHIAQMAHEDIRRDLGADVLRAIVRPHVSQEEHHRHKYVLNIRGNTCCWSRVPMILNSNSLLLNLRHGDGTWYYPMLQAGTHFVPVPSLNSLPDVVQQCDSNPAWCEHITQNAREFVRQFCSPTHAAYYAKCLFEAMALNK